MNIMKDRKTYIICLLVIVVVFITSIYVKCIFLPVPDVNQIRKMAKEYAKTFNNTAVIGEIYRDLYSDEARMNSWRCEMYYYTDINVEHELIIRYHPITGKIISVEEIEM